MYTFRDVSNLPGEAISENFPQFSITATCISGTITQQQQSHSLLMLAYKYFNKSKITKKLTLSNYTNK